MSVDIGKVSAEGIRYKNIRYTCTKAIQEHWFEKARNMTFIYIKDENTSGYLVCEMDRTSAYYGKSLSEIEYYKNIKAE